jgi:hypothetical protein
LDARAQIFSIHLKKRGRTPEEFDLAALAAASEGYSGAEIEQTPAPSAVAPAVVAPPAPVATAYDAQYIATHLMRARAEAGCDALAAGPTTVFCPALRGWDTGTQGALPAGPVALAGVTTWIPTSTPFAEADAQHRRLSFLGIRTDATGRYGALVSPGANMPMESAAVAQALGTVSAAAPTGSSAPLGLSFGLHGFANGQAQQARYPIATTGQGWQLQGGSFADIRRVGNTWVAIEVPRRNPAGLYFSVFVDSPLLAQ